jgi:hypothetical protein
VRKKGPDGLVDVGSFVLCTVQVPLSRVGPMIQDIRVSGAESKHLWGFKRRAFEEITQRKVELYNLLEKPSESVSEVLSEVSRVFGLGLPKASFLMQCMGWNTACLDVHNLKRMSIPIGLTKVGKVGEDTRKKKIDRYVEIVQSEGSETLWNDWCSHIAGNRWNQNLPTADAVSAYHVECIING